MLIAGAAHACGVGVHRLASEPVVDLAFGFILRETKHRLCHMTLLRCAGLVPLDL